MPAWCPHCGTMLPEGLEQCPKCGKSLKQAANTDPDKLSPAEFRTITFETLRILLIPIAMVILLGILCYWMMG